jgi:hypothetical protein
MAIIVIVIITNAAACLALFLHAPAIVIIIFSIANSNKKSARLSSLDGSNFLGSTLRCSALTVDNAIALHGHTNIGKTLLSPNLSNAYASTTSVTAFLTALTCTATTAAAAGYAILLFKRSIPTRQSFLSFSIRIILRPLLLLCCCVNVCALLYFFFFFDGQCTLAFLSTKPIVAVILVVAAIPSTCSFSHLSRVKFSGTKKSSVQSELEVETGERYTLYNACSIKGIIL